MFLARWLPVIISRLLSVIQASSLRERYYTLEQRNEILEVAIDDIKRINRNGAGDQLIEDICTRIKPAEH